MEIGVSPNKLTNTIEELVQLSQQQRLTRTMFPFANSICVSMATMNRRASQCRDDGVYSGPVWFVWTIGRFDRWRDAVVQVLFIITQSQSSGQSMAAVAVVECKLARNDDGLRTGPSDASPLSIWSLPESNCVHLHWLRCAWRAFQTTRCRSIIICVHFL